MSSPLTAYLGLYQGRIRPTNHTPLTGTGAWSYVLGHDLPGQVFTLGDGESVKVEQTADFNDDEHIRATGKIRFPETAPPTDWVWRLIIDTGGTTYTFDLDRTLYGVDEIEVGEDFLGVSVANLPDVGQVLSYELRLVYVPGGPVDPVEVELPAVYLDAIAFAEPADLFLTGRYPEPGDLAIPHTAPTPTVRVVVASNDGNSVDLSSTQIYVRGVLAYDGGGGGFQAGFAGTVTQPFGAGVTDALFDIDLAAQAFVSEEVVDVRVVSATTGVATIDETYAFTLADIAAPEIAEVAAVEKSFVRVTFNEAVLQGDGTATNDALNPANYTFDRQTAPAANVEAVAVTAISATEVEVETDIELTFNASYLLTVTGVEDLAGNVVMVPTNSATFTGFVPVIPAGRRFDLYQMLPAVNRREDETQDLQKFMSVLQESFDLWLCLIDRFTDIIDIDIAPEFYVDLILCDLGNPFRFTLDLIDKRRLARVLVDIYRQKGTCQGIVNAVRFFLGVEIDCDAFNLGDYWIIGESELGIGSVLGPSSQALLYSFQLISAEFQTTTVMVNDTTDGDYTITLNSEDYTFPASGNTAQEIRDGLLDELSETNAPELIGLITATADGTTDIILTGLIGTAFNISVSSPTAGGLTFNTTTLPTLFTDEQVAIIKEIADYMKPAHTHCVRVVQPEPPDLIDHWEIGVSLLGINTLLH